MTSGAMPLPRAASGSVALLHLGYLANVTNKGHTDFLSGLPSEYTLMTKCHAELALPLTSYCTVASTMMWEQNWSYPSPGQFRRVGRLTNSATTQAQIQGFELACPNVHPMLEHLMGVVLQNQSCGISLTQDSRRIAERTLGEGPVLMV